MTSKQPKALRLADALDLYSEGDWHQRDVEEAAAELRRLHEVNAELLNVLGEAELVLAEKLRRLGAQPHVSPTYHRIRDSIAKATGKQYEN